MSGAVWCSLPAAHAGAETRLLWFAVKHKQFVGKWRLRCFVCWCGARHGLIRIITAVTALLQHCRRELALDAIRAMKLSLAASSYV